MLQHGPSETRCVTPVSGDGEWMERGHRTGLKIICGCLTRAACFAACLAAGTLLFTPGLTAQDLKLPAAFSRDSRPNPRALRFESSHDDANHSEGFVARTQAFTIYLTSEEADLILHHETIPQGVLSRGKVIVAQAYAVALRMRFVDANPPTEIVPVNFEGDGGASSEKTRQSYSGVIYRGIYPGTDVLFHGSREGIALELDFSPGADPSSIVLELDGVTKIELDAAGNALISSGAATLRLAKPVAFLKRGGFRQRISSYFMIEPQNRLRFVVDAAAMSKPALMD
jgi:hypothetical protein